MHFRKCGPDIVTSATVRIQALYPAEGILPSISSYHQLLIINLASVPGGQLAIPQLHKCPER